MSTANALDLFPQPAFDFLSRPPPQKKRPAGPIPSIPPLTTDNLITIAPSALARRGSATGILTWASKVVPGTPAPISPPTVTPTSTGRRPSFTSRRSSVSWTGGRRPSFTTRRPSAALINVLEGPLPVTPSLNDCNYDLSGLGYTYAVVPLPTSMEKNSPSSKSHQGPLRRLRSRFRSKSISAEPLPSSPVKSKSPSVPKTRATTTKASRRRSRSVTTDSRPSTAERKKVAYGNMANTGATLEQGVALMQFMDGGSTESNIKNLMRQKAKAERKERDGLDFGCRGDEGVLAVDGVYRDEKGGIWRDEYEQWEYFGLLDEFQTGKGRASNEWVGFNANGEISSTGAAENGEEDRRPSVSTQDSDLDPRYVIPIASMENVPIDIDIDVCAPTSTPLSSSATPVPGPTMLTIPSRPSRPAPHLRKAPSIFLEAFVPRLPDAHQRSHSLPDNSPVLPRGRDRRRPAPLNLLPLDQQPHLTPSISIVQGNDEAPDARDAFLGDSFEPAPAPSHASEPVKVPKVGAAPKKTLGKKASMLNLGVGLLKKVGGGK